MGDILKFRRAAIPAPKVSSEIDSQDSQRYAVTADAMIYLWAYYRWLSPDKDRELAVLEILERQRGPEAWVAVLVPKWVHEAVNVIIENESACREALSEHLLAWARNYPGE